MKFVVLIGRILFSAIFILAALGHFSRDAIESATAYGMPLALILVPLAGLVALIGGVSVLVGYKARYGAWLLVIFLIPITIILHPFWQAPDELLASIQQAMFLKNLSLLGAALLITYFGSGPLSIEKE